MNGIVTVIVLIAGLLAAINFVVNYLGFYKARKGKRRLRKSERRTMRIIAFGIAIIIVADCMISYAAAASNRILSIILLALNALLLIGLVIGVCQCTDRQAGILGAVALPTIVCIAITAAGTFPTSLAAALFSLGGALVVLGVFRIVPINFNWTARSARHLTP